MHELRSGSEYPQVTASIYNSLGRPVAFQSINRTINGKAFCDPAEINDQSAAKSNR